MIDKESLTQEMLITAMATADEITATGGEPYEQLVQGILRGIQIGSNLVVTMTHAKLIQTKK